MRQVGIRSKYHGIICKLQLAFLETILEKLGKIPRIFGNHFLEIIQEL